jgi:hypothetical protein
VGARSDAGDEERRAGEGLVRCGVLRGSSGRLLYGRGGGERPGEAEKRLVMVGSFNGFDRFGIEGVGEQRGWGRAPFREEEGRRRGRLSFLRHERVGRRHQGGGCSQWWGAASSKGGRSPGGPLGPDRRGWAAWAGWQDKAGEVGATW